MEQAGLKLMPAIWINIPSNCGNANIKAERTCSAFIGFIKDIRRLK